MGSFKKLNFLGKGKRTPLTAATVTTRHMAPILFCKEMKFWKKVTGWEHQASRFAKRLKNKKIMIQGPYFFNSCDVTFGINRINLKNGQDQKCQCKHF